MIDFAIALVSLSILLLLSLSLFPSGFLNPRATLVRRAVTYVLAAQSAAACLLVVWTAIQQPQSTTWTLTNISSLSGASITMYVDGVSSLMLLMVSVVGFVVGRFSIRYLDGEAMQGRYFRWLGFAIGAVSLLVVSGNLLMFFVAWVMTSFSLHQLLLHYRYREEAHRAAWTKFSISRLGDVFLIIALVLTFKSFGTFDFVALFQFAGEISSSGNATPEQIAIGWFLVLGAITKSAQFPFHTWLPDTMETPTPVSALMHAGIVNAGGYLIIRMNPLVSLAPQALATLAAIGAFTACFAGIVMMTQSSIKRSLAYSTIAQMGFMMLQSGLGAFAAALLHILAHSFYKAYAFLTSGSAIAQHRAVGGAVVAGNAKTASLSSVLAAAALSSITLLAAYVALGLSSVSGSGSLLLGIILCIAMTVWGSRLLAARTRATVVTAICGVTALNFFYVSSFAGVQRLVANSVPEFAPSPLLQWVVVGVFLAFLGLMALNYLLLRSIAPRRLEALRIHAANGFYVDTMFESAFGSLAKS